jgi:hypothetical protein
MTQSGHHLLATIIVTELVRAPLASPSASVRRLKFDQNIRFFGCMGHQMIFGAGGAEEGAGATGSPDTQTKPRLTEPTTRRRD